MTPVALITLAATAAVVAVVVHFDRLCLADLARTPDHGLRLLTRQGWTLLIIVWIGFGGLVYLTLGKWR